VHPVPETITDPDDPRLEPYARMRERDLVGRAGRFIAEGEVTLRLLLGQRSRFGADSILLLPERWPGLAEAVAACPAPPPVFLASRAVMSAVAGFPIHRGVLAVGLRGPEPDAATLVPPAPAPALVLGLAGLTNHDNVGAAFRNAAAFGADAVMLDADPALRAARGRPGLAAARRIARPPGAGAQPGCYRDPRGPHGTQAGAPDPRNGGTGARHGAPGAGAARPDPDGGGLRFPQRRHRGGHCPSHDRVRPGASRRRLISPSGDVTPGITVPVRSARNSDLRLKEIPRHNHRIQQYQSAALFSASA
jgi:hypothetical protein